MRYYVFTEQKGAEITKEQAIEQIRSAEYWDLPDDEGRTLLDVFEHAHIDLIKGDGSYEPREYPVEALMEVGVLLEE